VFLYSGSKDSESFHMEKEKRVLPCSTDEEQRQREWKDKSLPDLRPRS